MGKLRDSDADGGIIEMVARETGKGGVPVAWDSPSIVVVSKRASLHIKGDGRLVMLSVRGLEVIHLVRSH